MYAQVGIDTMTLHPRPLTPKTVLVVFSLVFLPCCSWDCRAGIVRTA